VGTKTIKRKNGGEKGKGTGGSRNRGEEVEVLGGRNKESFASNKPEGAQK